MSTLAHNRHWRTASGNFFLGCLAALVGCWPGPLLAAKPVTNAPALVWPAPPDEPRIAYERSLQGPPDFGVKRSVFGKFFTWLTGSTPANGQFIKPFGLAFDEQDNLCFTDTGANTVSYFDQAHKTLRRWDAVGKIHFASPVAVAKRGPVLYVADSALGSVVMFDEQGKLLSEIKTGLQRPTGLTLFSNRLFVVDSQVQAVLIFDLQGQPAGQFGERGTGPGEFNFPTHISADAAGNLFVTDAANGRVQVFDGQGRYLRQIGSLGDAAGRFSRPKGVAIDSYGHVYVIDANFDNVQLFDEQGRLLMTLGQSGHQPGEFWLPNGIAINRRNEIFVADAYNRRIQVFKFIGKP
jgi:sugar lactone lactonase YvrE